MSLFAPSWLSLGGVRPSWGVLWLLPWAVESGPLLGLLAGISIGLVLDAISLLGITHVPAFLLLGFWWGRLGMKGSPIENSLNFGFLAWIGSVVVAISLFAQQLLKLKAPAELFISWSWHTVLAKSIITGLLAPVACSWVVLLLRRNRSSQN